MKRGNMATGPDGIGLIVDVRSCGTVVHLHVEGMADLERGTATPGGGIHVGGGVVVYRAGDVNAHSPLVESLAMARARTHAGLIAGVGCPCCDQYARVYRRSLYAAMAAWLLWAARQESEVVSVNDGPVYQQRKGGGDYSKLSYWDLIRPVLTPGQKRSAGLWRVTSFGKAFALARQQVYSHVYVYDGAVYTEAGHNGFDGNRITIRQALQRRFDYDELMAAPADQVGRKISRQLNMFAPKPKPTDPTVASVHSCACCGSGPLCPHQVHKDGQCDTCEDRGLHRCKAPTKKGTPCRAWTKALRCNQHS